MTTLSTYIAQQVNGGISVVELGAVLDHLKKENPAQYQSLIGQTIQTDEGLVTIS